MTHDSRFASRYPYYNVLDKWSTPSFDDQTRKAVSKRMQVPDVRFFTDDEIETLRAVAECVVPQPDRGAAQRVPLECYIDEKLHKDEKRGYRYADVPPQREAWRRALRGIEQTAHALYGAAFRALDDVARDAVLRRIADGDPPGEAWEGMNAKRFFADSLCSGLISAYYAHPLAWNEIGYGGPASPRGYSRKSIGHVDPWEAQSAPARGMDK
jgi:hypothetical protein